MLCSHFRPAKGGTRCTPGRATPKAPACPASPHLPLPAECVCDSQDNRPEEGGLDVTSESVFQPHSGCVHSLLPWGWRRHTQNAWSQAGHTNPSYSEQGGARRRRGLPALTVSPDPHVLTRGSGEAAGGQDRGPSRDDNHVSSGDGVGVVSTA